MGTGGATALRSPEDRIHRSNSGPLVTRNRISPILLTSLSIKRTRRFPDICIHVYLQLRTEFFQIALINLPHEWEGGIDQAKRVISTTKLSMLPCLHPWPINVVVCHDPSGRINLGRGLALRCFQRLSFPNIAAQHCR